MKPKEQLLALGNPMPNPIQQNLFVKQRPSRANLSKTELLVLRYISLGYSDEEIADTLFLIPQTIKIHRNSIKEKLRYHKSI